MNRLVRRLINQLIYNRRYAIVPKRVQPFWPQRKFIRDLLTRQEIDCVFDVGANVGQYAEELRNLDYDGLILSFEPDPKCFKAASAAAAHDPKWHVYNTALGAEPGEGEFHLMEWSDFNSFLTPSERETSIFSAQNRVVETVTVPIDTLDRTLPSLAAEFGFKRPFLKMDTQGYDLQVFRGAAGVRERIVALQSEVPIKRLYEGSVDWRDAIDEYRTGGFDLVALFPVSPAEKHLLEFDCYMINPGMAK